MEHPHKTAIAEVRNNKSFHYSSFLTWIHISWNSSKSIKLLSCLFAEIVYVYIKFQIRINDHSKQFLRCVIFYLNVINAGYMFGVSSKKWQLSAFAFIEFFENQSNSLADELYKVFMGVWISWLAQYGLLSSV